MSVDLNELREWLAKLSDTFGPSGRERAVRGLIRAHVEGLADRVEVDALGNLIAYKAGSEPEPRLRVMLAAHTDEVGFMITKIEKSGLLRFHQIGGIDGRLLPAKRVVIGDDRVPGIIGAPVPHLQTAEQARKPVDANNLTVDIGATNEKQAQEKVRVGDYGTFATTFTVLNEDAAWPTVRGKAFDNRAGCVALLALLHETYPVDLVAVFTSQEEMGLRGARVAGHRVEPDMALALDATICDDRPQAPEDDQTPVTRVGAGPALTLMDRSMIAHPGVLRLLREAAESEGVPYQYKAPGMGGTDAGAIHLGRAGVPSGVVAVPCRYIHGPDAILNLNDLAHAVRLVAAALRKLDGSYLGRD